MAGTGVAVPSDAIADFKANADTLDQLVNSESLTALGRETPTNPAGKTLTTVEGLKQAILKGVAGGIYPDTATGLAATTVGGYFNVIGTGAVFATLYLHDTGSVATVVHEYPTKAHLDAQVTAAAASASAAATSAGNAATSETNAATSASNAATSAGNAATSETNAASSAAAALASETAAATSASDAENFSLASIAQRTNLSAAVVRALKFYNEDETELRLQFDEDFYVEEDKIGTFDDVLSIVRATDKTGYDRDGKLVTFASGVRALEFDPVTGESLGVSVHEQRTNLLTYSEQFDDASWTKNQTTVTANAATAPDGTTTADKLISTAVAGFHSTAKAVASKLASTTYTFSLYAKAAEIGFILPNFSSAFSGSGLFAIINLSTGEATGVSAGLTVKTEDAGNGWWRISLTATSAANTTAFSATVNTTDAAGNSSHTGDGVSGVLVWGAQLEVGSFATPYIKTVAATATRNADIITDPTISDWFNLAEGAFVVKFRKPPVGSVSKYAFGLEDVSNRASFGVDAGSSLFFLRAQDATVATAGVIANDNVLVVSYSNGVITAAAGNGTSLASWVGKPITANPTFLGIGSSGSLYLNSTIKDILYYRRSLSATEAQLLSAI